MNTVKTELIGQFFDTSQNSKIVEPFVISFPDKDSNCDIIKFVVSGENKDSYYCLIYENFEYRIPLPEGNWVIMNHKRYSDFISVSLRKLERIKTQKIVQEFKIPINQNIEYSTLKEFSSSCFVHIYKDYRNGLKVLSIREHSPESDLEFNERLERLKKYTRVLNFQKGK